MERTSFFKKGREILLKAVALDLSTYTMQIFRLPDTLCSDLESMMARFWWGGTAKKKKLHWRKWGKLCQPKAEGVSGFKDPHTFNKALLAKQGWRVVVRSYLLVARVLKGKYFGHGDFLLATMGLCLSYLWHSLMWGKDILEKGLRWQVGDGMSICVFKDPWLVRPLTFRHITRPTNQYEDTRVAKLLDPATGVWNEEALLTILWPVHIESMKELLLSLLVEQIR